MMNVVFYIRKGSLEDGMVKLLKQKGHRVTLFAEPIKNNDLDSDFILKLSEFLLKIKNTDMIISINYFPVIAKVCNIHKILYISYVVDCPHFPLYSKSLASPYCKSFIFDKTLFDQIADLYPENVIYLPLGANTDYYDGISPDANDHRLFDCDISFVGTFHTQFNVYDDIKEILPRYMQGYCDGLIEAQLNIYGYNIFYDSLSEEWAYEFKKYVNWDILPDYHEDARAIVVDKFLGYKCTNADRIRTLDAVSKQFNIDLYTTEDTSRLPAVHNRGPADTFTMAPKIFKCSKINLNITSRTIKSGLPLRIFDIMGSGGFVISNYQSEIPEYFTPDEDIVMYDSIPDLLDKIDYYLRHDDERIKIAQNGYRKVKKHHTLNHRVDEILGIINK